MMMKMTFTEDEVKQILINGAQRYLSYHTTGAWTAAKKNSYSADIDVFWDPSFVPEPKPEPAKPEPEHTEDPDQQQP